MDKSRFTKICLSNIYSDFISLENTNPLSKLLFYLSGVITTGLIITSTNSGQNSDILVSILLSAIGAILGSIVWYYTIYKFNLIRKIGTIHKSFLLDIVSLVFAITTICYFIYYIYRGIEIIGISWITQNVVSTIIIQSSLLILGGLALYVVFLAWRKIIDILEISLHNLYLRMDRIDKLYLLFTITITFCHLCVTYNLSNVFYVPQTIENEFPYGVLYGADTGGVVGANAYTYIGSYINAFHQPLFGLFAIPFGVVATILSKIFFFIPNSDYIFLQLLQISALSISTILLYHLINKAVGVSSRKEQIIKVIFYFTVTLSSAYIVNTLMMEQFVLSSFWLILFTYLVVNKNKYADLTFIAASGSTLTNGVLFPFLSNKFDIRKYIHVFVTFLGVIVISGQLPKLLNFVNGIISYSAYTGGSATILQKIEQWINFIASCFFTPGGRDVIWNYGFECHVYLQDAVTSINIIGVILCCIFIVGFFMNFRDTFTKICFTWFLFSLLLMGLVGFGYGEMFMYSILFTWAYISLLYISLMKLLKNHPIILFTILGLIIISLIVINIPALFNLISFGITYYPA